MLRITREIIGVTLRVDEAQYRYDKRHLIFYFMLLLFQNVYNVNNNYNVYNIF